jgi:hypothetical protein
MLYQIQSLNKIITKYFISRAKASEIFYSVVLKQTTRASAVWIYSFIFKDFYLKNRVVALGHDWQKYLA